MLFASDIDGTLLRNDETLSARTRSAVHRAVLAGGFVYATGRPARWVHPVSELTGHEGIAICSNGAHVVDLRDGSTIETHEITSQHLAEVVVAVRSIVPAATFAIQWLEAYGHTPDYVPVFALPPEVRIAPIEALIEQPALKLLFRARSLTPDALRAIETAIGTSGSLTYGATPSAEGSSQLIEVMAHGVSKASALEALAQRWGTSADEVIAFGDNRNDVEMLAWAGHGVAMANAVPEAMAVANEVTASNDDDGVAQVIERLLR